MKFNIILTMIVISASAVFTACDDSGDDSLKSGTISGSAVFTTSSGNAQANVKLAAVYYPEYASMSTDGAKIISNVVDLGIVPNTGKAFSLDINFENATSPKDGSAIILTMWTDTNDDNIMDGSEKFAPTEANTGCPVFGSSTLCCLLYHQEWSISTGDGDEDIAPFESAVKTGAKIISGTNMN